MSIKDYGFKMIDPQYLYSGNVTHRKTNYNKCRFAAIGEQSEVGRVHELMCAVLWRAIEDIKTPHLVSGNSAQAVWLTAKEFFESIETGITELNFTFMGICEELNLCASRILALVAPYLDDCHCPKHFQPWEKRNAERALRNKQIELQFVVNRARI